MIYRVLYSSFFFLFLLINSITGQSSNFIFSGETIPLKGEWNFVMNEFLSADEIHENTKNVKIAVPGTWNEVKWEGQKIGPYGYGTYYTTIILDEDVKKHQLAIEVSEISLAYKLFVNGKEIGGKGLPGKTKSEEKAKIDYNILDFEPSQSDTLSIIFHVSNFSHESGGLWYAPSIGIESSLRENSDFNKAIKLLILGFIIIAGVFQLYVFLRRRKEKFALYFFLICVSLVLLTISRGDMPIMDFFPSTSWVSLKKIVYISIFLIVPTNALFLRELYPDFYHKNIVLGTTILSLLLVAFTLIISPRISYAVIPYYHIYNLVLGVYLFISLCRAAYHYNFGARFLLAGYVFGFIMAIHDILKSQYVIEGFAFDLIHLGTVIYIFQLIAVIATRYIMAIEGREQLSSHLRKVNDELEETIDRRTKKLSEQNQIIESQNERLQEAMEEKNDLMAVVAHDLKAPFDGISSISELMKPELEGSALEFNNMIKKMTMNGKNLIENLTQLGYYEKEDFEVELLQADMEEFFKEKCMSFEKIAQEKGVTLTSSFDSAERKFITDKSLLDRIVDNLLSNAIKFSPVNEKVHFKLNVENDLKIAIKDNGPGFSETDKEKAFGKFQKLSAKPTAGESSTGLGLSIVKTLIELLNGDVQIISEEGKGAEIIISIPKPEQ